MKYIDISYYQGAPDFERLRLQIDGVILRAGYGRNNIDAQFLRSIRECNRVGLPCGVYWFSYAYTPAMAAQEAEYCLAAIRPFRVELPVCFDFEYDSVKHAEKQGVAVTPALANSMAGAFCSAVEAAGYYAMLYANPDFLSRYFTDVSRFDLWLAQWKNNPDLSAPPRKCGIWQWGGRRYDGINTGDVDSNEAYLDYAALIRGARLNHLQPAAAPEEPKIWYADALGWAQKQGISDGSRPTDPATRAEVFQMLYNYDRPRSGLLTDED